MRRFLAIAGLVVAGAAAALVPSAANAGVHAKPHGVPPGVWNIWNANGQQMCVGVGAGGDNAGQPVMTKSDHANCSALTDTYLTSDVNGLPEYYWTFNNGNYMAATNDCTKVTIKSSALSNGTVWILNVDPAGDFILSPRYCNPNGFYAYQLSSNNTAGTQWNVSTTGYRALILHEIV